MAGSDSPKPIKPIPPRSGANSPRKPLQVMHISRKNEEKISKDPQSKKVLGNDSEEFNPKTNSYKDSSSPIPPLKTSVSDSDNNNKSNFSEKENELTMEALLNSEKDHIKQFSHNQNEQVQLNNQISFSQRIVDDFDFDEDEFIAALNQNEPIGNTGEIAKGKVIGVESDGVYVDIGGKAPGFMPKNECGLGVITNLKERFPKNLEVEVLVTREQNADGMVTISCRALALRKSWEKVKSLEKDGKVVQVIINGFNRGGVTCELEGLRGFIPRSQLEEGEKHELLVGKTLGVTFLEVNPESRKLVLSEKKAATAKIFADLKIGQLVEGKVISIKPYGFFVDLGGISGLLHHSVVTNGSLRALTEVFKKGDQVKALITDLDPRRSRIGLNTALLEGPPGEIIVEKEKVMLEAAERAQKAQNAFKNINPPNKE